MKTIGTTGGKKVIYSNGVARVYGTSIMIANLKDEKHAIERCMVNLKGFKEYKAE